MSPRPNRGSPTPFRILSPIHQANRQASLHIDGILKDLRVSASEGQLLAFVAARDGVPAYYGQFKVSSDSGPLGTFLFENRKDHVFGIGGEANVFLPKPKLLVGLRIIPEFGAVNRTEGFTFMVTLGYQAKSLLKTP
jgi:hypothetical protein